MSFKSLFQRDNFYVGLAFILLAVGLVSRLLPAFSDIRLFHQFPTDDGYYMLTMARNLALGMGISVSNGEVLTNGTQPLITFVWSGFYWLSGGDKTSGLIFIHLFQVACASLSTALLYLLAKRLLPNRPWRSNASLWTAALWFSAEGAASHSMNSLETGPLVLAVLVFFYQYLNTISLPVEQQSYTRWASLGVTLGILFWIRNDAAFIAIILAATRIINMPGKSKAEQVRFFTQAFLIGSISGLIAIPWMWFNYANFGHIMPISGVAESLMKSHAFHNVDTAIREIASTTFILIPPIPRLSWYDFSIAVPAIIALLPIGFMLAFHKRFDWPREWLELSKIWIPYAAILFIFYAFFFGARWMIPRYFFPFSPFMAILIMGIAGSLWEKSGGLKKLPLIPVAAILLSMNALKFHTALYQGGNEHRHQQMTDWVTSNVSDTTWVAAWQSGMLGYFHDRTLNLDGKVNPAVLDAILNSDRESYFRDIEAEYILDWKKIIFMEEHYSSVENYYDVILDSKEKNLAVLKRRG